MKVSIIIPVYNSQKYIDRCLKSVLNQTLDDIEIVCVSCGSTDNSVKIIREYADKDTRVRLIEPENKAEFGAENERKDFEFGEYVIFLNADDSPERDMLRSMYEKCLADHADICLGGCSTYDEETGEDVSVDCYITKAQLPEQTPFSSEDIAEKIFSAEAPALCTMLFKKAFLAENGFEFKTFDKFNAFCFVYTSLACAGKITYADDHYVKCKSKSKKAILSEFYDDMRMLKKELQTRKLFQKFEKSFVNMALNRCLDVLASVSAKEDFTALAENIQKSYLYELNVLGHSRGYFYNQNDFDRLLNLMSKKAEELWEEKINQPEKVKRQKIDINEWQPSVKIEENGEIKVSVIIPIYNTEKYIAECLDSIINNSLKDIEIICVNDGSTDNTLEILNSYAEKDSRITVINKENSGPSASRNAGMEVAKGKYILFIDSDDFIEPRALEYLYCEAEKDNLDQLYFCAKSFYDNDGFSYESMIDYYPRKADYSNIMSGREMFIIQSNNAEFRPSPCLQFNKKSFLDENNIRFIEGIIYEDNPFTIQCLSCSKRVRYSDIDLYNRRLRKNSIITGSAGIRSSYNYYLVIKNIERIAQENKFSSDPEFYEALLVQLERTCFLSSNYAGEAEEEELKSFIFSLDEKEGMDYYFYIKIAMKHRAIIKSLRKTIKDTREKNLMDKFKNDCREYKRIEEEKAIKREVERLKSEKLAAEKLAAEKQAAYERTLKGRIGKMLR